MAEPNKTRVVTFAAAVAAVTSITATAVGAALINPVLAALGTAALFGSALVLRRESRSILKKIDSDAASRQRPKPTP